VKISLDPPFVAAAFRPAPWFQRHARLKPASTRRKPGFSHRLFSPAGAGLKAGATAFFSSLLLFSASCSRNSTANNSPQVTVEAAPDPNLIEIDHPERFVLTRVEVRKDHDALQVNGTVAPDVARTVPVLSLAGGRAVDIRARLGDDVTKGQVLVTISSPDIAQAFSDYTKFQADELFAHQQLLRSEGLYDKGAIAQRDLEAAENAENKAKTDVQNGLERLRILGADPNHPSPLIDVRAPVSGTIVEQNVVGGTAVRSTDNSPNLFTIADLSSVWVLCDVYENNLSQVHLGDFAEVRLNAYPNRVLRGRVGNISRVLDPATRTAKVRLELENPGGIMRSGMFATATFHSQAERNVTVVPSKAILRLHDKDWVFRSEGGGKFHRTQIEAGAVAPDNSQEVLSGLSPGNQVVVDALQFSNAAEEQ
jgi:cobalt-zinc-cadmium efflux system membrane fusion protein